MALRKVAPVVSEKQVKVSYRRVNWTGKRVGRLIVLSCKGKRLGNFHTWLWKCKCDCGKTFVTSSDSLRSGKTFSCGCLFRERVVEALFKHGLVRSVEYNLWTQIKRRCDCPRFHQYKNYGGRGITMCQGWRDSFETFLRDVGVRPSPDHSLDRYPNNDGNYEPGNVRWATRKEQCRNKRDNHLVTVDGVTKTIVEWTEHSGLSRQTISARLGAGWTPKDAITLPLHTKYWMHK